MMNNNEIKVVCKRCKRSMPASSFVLDPVYKLMVCPLCVKERKDKVMINEALKHKEKENALKAQEQKSRPAGWDSEDDYLEKAAKQRTKIGPEVQRISDDKVKYTCVKCKYKFVYDEARKYPSACPYCGTKIMTFGFR